MSIALGDALAPVGDWTFNVHIRFWTALFLTSFSSVFEKANGMSISFPASSRITLILDFGTLSRGESSARAQGVYVSYGGQGKMNGVSSFPLGRASKKRSTNPMENNAFEGHG